jgi:phosphatidylinositol-3-phosphatase
MVMVNGWRRLLAAAVFLLVLAACTSTAGRPGPGTGTAGTPAGSGPAAPGGLRAVRHVWVIELENKGYTQSFGTPSADPYLARTLPRIGALLENYYAIGHSSAGCVYPAAVQTLGNQLSAAGRSWAAYLQDIGNDPARDNTAADRQGT